MRVPLLVITCMVLVGGVAVNQTSSFPPPGIYNSKQIKFQTFQLNIDNKGNGSFRTIISLHVPPVIVDEMDFTGNIDVDGRYCIKPKPKLYPQCFKILSNGKLEGIKDEKSQPITLELTNSK